MPFLSVFPVVAKVPEGDIILPILNLDVSCLSVANLAVSCLSVVNLAVSCMPVVNLAVSCSEKIIQREVFVIFQIYLSCNKKLEKVLGKKGTGYFLLKSCLSPFFPCEEI